MTKSKRLAIILSVVFVAFIVLAVAFPIIVNKPKEFVYEVITENGKKYVLFGEYPQSLKKDDVTITGTPDLNGYYTGSDGAKYAKQQFILNTDIYNNEEDAIADKQNIASDGTVLTYNEYYYFKVEKLKWRILKEYTDGTALIVCDNIIQAIAYQPNAVRVLECWLTNDDGERLYEREDGTFTTNSAEGTSIDGLHYKHSNLRKFLNNNFLNIAFNTQQLNMIDTVEVDNSASTTDDVNNSRVCENTFDKVFALSYQDLINPDYGFSSDPNESDINRVFMNTDYSRATGASNFTQERLSDTEGLQTYLYGSGNAHLRSPNDSWCANWGLRYGKFLPLGQIWFIQRGALPALQINFNK